MNIWILTIGSSDVQLKTKANWTKLFREVRSELDDRGFTPSDGDGKERLFQVKSRVLGTVYSQPQAESYFNDLTFPLIDNFICKLKEKEIKIDKVVLVLSDQSIFDRADRSHQGHPYWKDTITLQTLLDKYIKAGLKESSPDLQVQHPPLILKASSKQDGLDNWDFVLKIVQGAFSDLDFPENATIYVSHQAGTPAISSAVQFCSLAKFGDRVQFLVSNEYKSELTDFVPSSSYLKGIKREQAKELLKNYDYAGVNQLVGADLQGENRTLLDAALKWNVAKFVNPPKPENDESSASNPSFLEVLKKHSKFLSVVEERTTAKNWWWIAYEEVYLAIIREKQSNIVEAFFHSFRAFEGIFTSWGQVNFEQHIEILEGISYLNPSILIDSNHPFSNISGKKAKKAVSNIKSKLEKLYEKLQSSDLRIPKDEERVEMDLSTLCNLFKAIHYTDYKQNCPDLQIFWDDDEGKRISNKRNQIFHQVQGMNESDLWEFWGVSSEQEWQDRLLMFLNFIIKKDYPEGFASLQEASLMPQVHKQLVEAIVSL